MNKVTLTTPWAEYYNELEALFAEDPDVKIAYDNDEYTVKIFVDGTAKADALAQLLPTEKAFGNVTLTIIVVPANESPTRASLIRDAFMGNEALSYIQSIEGIMSNPMTFVVFKNKVVQYFNDDLGDINGMRSTLYQDIAKEIIGQEGGIFFCTDLPDEE